MIKLEFQDSSKIFAPSRSPRSSVTFGLTHNTLLYDIHGSYTDYPSFQQSLEPSKEEDPFEKRRNPRTFQLGRDRILDEGIGVPFSSKRKSGAAREGIGQWKKTSKQGQNCPLVLRQAASKLPTKMEFISRDTPPRLGNLVLYPPKPVKRIAEESVPSVDRGPIAEALATPYYC
ncbi:hypothetical protein F5879DRAFT_1060103 [Lentinula edodes]|nr:hypothetical protein F5879DRAFT_1060103 [Lentinula edodes]